MGAHYIGSYSRDDESKSDWLKYQTENWEINIRAVTETVGKHPQESYSMVFHSIRSEWIFLQHVAKMREKSFCEYKKFCRKPCYLVFSLGNELSTSRCRKSKYVSGKEIRYGPIEPTDISSR